MSTFAEAVEQARQVSAGYVMGRYTQPGVKRSELAPGDWRLSPRVGTFTCKRCDVGELNPPEAKDSFTPWPCWFCGQDDMTLPRPIIDLDSEPAPATEKAPS